MTLEQEIANLVNDFVAGGVHPVVIRHLMNVGRDISQVLLWPAIQKPA